MLTHLDSIPYKFVPRVLSLVGPADVCNIWRTWWPSGFLQMKGFVADFCGYDEFLQRLPLIESGRYNTIITPRITFADETIFQNWFEHVERAGLTWIYDADDDLFSPEFTDIQVHLKDVLGLDREQAESQRLQRLRLIQRAHGITVSSAGLAEVVMHNTPETVHVLRNLINMANFRYGLTLKPRLVEGLTVGWSGTLRNESDLKSIAKAWRQISLVYPDVQFVVQGYEADVLCRAVPPSRLKIIPGVSVGEYPAALKNIDILCCSVQDTPWNRRKTPIKWIEGSLAGAVCVVSDVLYGNTVDHERTGLVAHTDEEWFTHIGHLISTPEHRMTLQARAVYEIERHHSLERCWQEWILTWATILDERVRLNAAYAEAAV